MWNQRETRYSDGFSPAPVGGAAEGLERSVLLRIMDEMDHGLVVIDEHSRVRHSNHLARHEMATARILMGHGGHLLGVTDELSEQIQAALDHALRGQRRLVQLKHNAVELALAFIPLSHPLEPDAPTVLVLFSRQNSCENLAVRMYARAQGLSPSEEQVMIALCRGLSIPEIAQENSVAESTVRSQIKAVREKTGCHSIRLLMQRLANLPPVVPALRVITPIAHNAGHFHQP